MKQLIFTLWLFSLLLVIVMVGDGNSQPLDRATPEALLSRYIETRAGREDVLALGATIVPLLRRHLADEQPEVRWLALDLLGQPRHPIRRGAEPGRDDPGYGGDH